MWNTLHMLKRWRTLFFSPNMYGAFLVFLGGVFSAGTNALTHGLPKTTSSFQILMIKAAFSFVLICLFYYRSLGTIFKTTILRYHVLKSLFGTVGNGLWIFALLWLPLAQSSALSLTSAIFTSIGGWVLFKERFVWPIWFALLLGAFGVYLIVSPRIGALHLQWVIFLPLMSALAFSGSSLVIKRLAKDDSSITTLVYLMGFMALFAAPMAIFQWEPLTLQTWVKLAGVSVCYTITQLCLIEAYSYAAASFIAPFKFARFPLNIAAGMLFFGEWPPLMTIGGGICIILAYSLLTLYEKRQRAHKKDNKEIPKKSQC